MLYDDKVCTVYRVANGFEVECIEPPEPPDKKSAKTDSPCCGPMTDTETYTASSEAEVLKLVKDALANAPDEYGEAFDEATTKKK